MHRAGRVKKIFKIYFRILQIVYHTHDKELLAVSNDTSVLQKQRCILAIGVYKSLMKTNLDFVGFLRYKTCSLLQKQPSRAVLRKRYSQNIQQIYRRAPMPIQ